MPEYDDHRWLEMVNPSTDFMFRSSNCPGKFFAGWGEHPTSPVVQDLTAPDPGHGEYIILECTAGLNMSDVIATVDHFGNVIQVKVVAANTNATNASMLFPTEMYTKPGDHIAHFVHSFLDVLIWDPNAKFSRTSLEITGLLDDEVSAVWNPHHIMWINALMVAMEPTIRRQGLEVSHLPNTTYLVRTFERVLGSLFAINLQLYSQLYFDLGEGESTQAIVATHEYRVALSTIMYWLATAILAFFILSFIYVYWSNPGSGIIHFPTTLVDTYTLLYASNAIEDAPKLHGRSTAERASKLLGLGNTYRCGMFMGQDGAQHIGLYKESSGSGGGEREPLTQGPSAEAGGTLVGNLSSKDPEKDSMGAKAALLYGGVGRATSFSGSEVSTDKFDSGKSTGVEVYPLCNCLVRL